MATLRKDVNVIVYHPQNGKRVVLEGGSEVPVWAKNQIDASLLDGGEKANPAAPKGAPAVTIDLPKQPPRSGKGSGKGAWAEYAAAVGVHVPDGASAADIIAAVDAAKG